MSKTISPPARFAVTDFQLMKEKVLSWTQQFSTFCFLDNHQYLLVPHTMECLLGAGVKREIQCNTGDALEQLQQFINAESPRDRSAQLLPERRLNRDRHTKRRWLFGHLGYDLKNEMERVYSFHPDNIHFPDLFFFEPEIIVRLNENEVVIEADEPEKVFKAIDAIPLSLYSRRDAKTSTTTGPVIRNRISKEAYISIIHQLKQHILRGDCYEINFCQEFFTERVIIDPVSVYKKLSRLSPNPFSALYKVNDQWLICASPERFLKKQGNTILSQPIKGTAKRIEGNEKKDLLSKEELWHSNKDRSENVMVVDLVRNDLAKLCEEGTVKVDELFGIYSFPQVHQMISTISGELKDSVSFTDIIKATFPMGSMTGAPKKRVMELIEKYEKTKRGIFSGAVGYMAPGGDFDLNVVIRSILYNASSGYLSFQTGSGITFCSDPEKEWEECMLKAEAIRKVLASS